MKMMEKNHNEFDYQVIVAKKEKADELIKNYECFGWVAIDSNQHAQFENLVEIEFSRPHKIQNKDNLQFMQVNMEHYINQKGRLERKKHSKSLIWGLSSGIIAIFLIIFAVFSPIKVGGNVGITLCVVYAFLAFSILTLCGIGIAKLAKIEHFKFEKESKNCDNLISKICKQAKTFLGGEK